MKRVEEMVNYLRDRFESVDEDYDGNINYDTDEEGEVDVRHQRISKNHNQDVTNKPPSL